MADPDLLDRRTARQLKGECCYGACTDDALEGSDYCAPHDAHERGRAAAKQRSRRLRRANAGVCIGGCGRKVGKRFVKGRVVQRRCAACSKTHKEAERDRRGVPGDERGVPVSSSSGGHFKVEERATARADGTPHKAHVRYVGRAHRGGPTRAEIDADMLRDARRARSLLLHFEEKGLPILRDIEAQQPTRSQRAEVRILAGDPVGQAFRLAVSIFAAVHPDGKRAVQDWFTAWLSGE